MGRCIHTRRARLQHVKPPAKHRTVLGVMAAVGGHSQKEEWTTRDERLLSGGVLRLA